MMKNQDFVKRLQDFGRDMDPILIEFPDAGGPFRSPSNIQALVGTDDVIIGACYPRTDDSVRSLYVRLMMFEPDGRVELFLNDPHFGPPAYFDVRGFRLHERAVVIIAGDVIAV